MFKKRNILLLNVVLLVVFCLTCYGTIKGFVRKPEVVQKQRSITEHQVVAYAVERPARSEYNIITKNNIFDAKLRPEAPPPPPEVAPPINWKLQGTFYMGGEWVAFIEMRTAAPRPAPKRTGRGRPRRAKRPPPVKNKVIPVKEGERILEYDVTILEIRSDYVKYARSFNNVTTEDYLYLEKPSEDLITGFKADYTAIVAPMMGRRNEYNISQPQLKKKIADINQLKDYVTLQEHEEPSGEDKKKGLQITEAKNLDLLNAFGLAEEDIILKIDDREVESIEKLTEILNSINEKTSIAVEIQRGKKKLKLTYHLTS